MLINDIDNLTVTIDEIESTDEYITVIIANEDTEEEVGRLRILKKRYDTFLLSLSTMMREVYGVFEERESSNSRQVNKTSGVIRFISEA